MCDSPELLAALERIETALRFNGGNTTKPIEESFADQDFLISNTQSTLYLDYKGRKHLYLYTATALTLQLNDMGTVAISANIWTEVSFRPVMQLFPTNQTNPVKVVIRATNEQILAANTAVTETNSAALLTDANLMIPGVQGWIAAAGTGTSGQDDALTFASQVRIVALYNASANNVPLEFDQTAAATSFPIPPGAFWIFDNVRCTTLHVFPSATLPINTTSGLYVKGWK